MKKIVVLTIFSILFFSLFSQPNVNFSRNWILGNDTYEPQNNRGGLLMNFQDNLIDIKLIKIPIEMNGTNSSISDKNGNLLFYTNGCAIAGKDHKVLQNGNNINAGSVSKTYCLGGGYISDQGAFFLQDLEKDSIYYLFHTGLEFDGNFPTVTTTLYQTTINANQNKGTGVVIEKNKVLIKDSLADEQLAAVKHGNGRDWWIVNPTFMNNRFIKFLLTPQGIKGPFMQKYGLVQKDTAAGQATFSPDGTKYARPNINKSVSLMRFDRCSGLFFNEINLPLQYYAVGVSFSPNSRFLYLMTAWKVYQYDTEATDIAASQTVILTNDGKEQPQGCLTYASQLAPDGKIYISCPGSTLYIHKIENPNIKGKACTFTLNALKLPVYNQGSMPYYPEYNLGKLVNSPCDTLKTSNTELLNILEYKIYPNPTSTALTLDINSHYQSILKLELYDGFGKKVLIQQLDNIENKHIIDLTNLPKGMYFYTIINNTEILKNGKIVKIGE
jgi:hypothetical protein